MKRTNARRPSSRQSLGAVFAMPLAIGLVGAVGLVSALAGDGWRDVVSWAGLALPIAVIGWAMAARRS